MGYKVIFPIFFEELLYVTMWLKLSNRILDCHFFHSFLLLVLHGVDFNVTTPIWMSSFWIFKRNFTSSTVLEFRVKTPINKKNFSSLMLANIELRFEHCVPNLIWKWCAKDPKRNGIPSNFHEFQSEEVCCNKILERRKTLMFEHYNLVDPMDEG
jgi:hypothetical protein